MKVALSTVALSAYNVLAKQPGPSEASRIFLIVKMGLMDEGVTQDVFARALAELQARGLICITEKDKGLIDVNDPRRRIVRWRNRSGAGWDNWLVDDIRGPSPVPNLSTDLGAAP